MAHYSKDYGARYGQNKKNTVEIAYINSGELSINLFDKEFIAPQGSVVVLFRHLPIITHTVGKQINSHYTVLAEFKDYEFELLDEDTYSEKEHLLIPFITPPCLLTESIRKKLCIIATSMEEDGEKNALFCSVSFLSILCELSKERYKRSKDKPIASQKLTSIICDYIDNNIEKPITIEVLSKLIDKSRNYTGYIFKKTHNITVSEYVNMQKAKKIAFLMQNNGLSFSDACECVSLSEITYGYRIFKKYMGLTPKEYMKMGKLQKN